MSPGWLIMSFSVAAAATLQSLCGKFTPATMYPALAHALSRSPYGSAHCWTPGANKINGSGRRPRAVPAGYHSSVISDRGPNDSPDGPVCAGSVNVNWNRRTGKVPGAPSGASGVAFTLAVAAALAEGDGVTAALPLCAGCTTSFCALGEEQPASRRQAVRKALAGAATFRPRFSAAPATVRSASPAPFRQQNYRKRAPPACPAGQLRPRCVRGTDTQVAL